VIRPTGQLIISISHPFVVHGRFASKETNSPFVVEGTYFGRQRSKVSRSAMACGCILPAGVTLSKSRG
jgi:hypothetical protein